MLLLMIVMIIETKYEVFSICGQACIGSRRVPTS